VTKPFLNAGFTTLMVAPSGADLSGTAALVNLSGQPVRDALVSANVGEVVNLGGNAWGPIYPSSLMGHIAQLRQTLLDAQWYTKVVSAYQHGGAHRPPVDDSLTALQPLIAGHTPAIFDALTEYQIVRALNISGEFGLKPIIAGGKEGWTQIEALKSAGAPVLLSLAFGKDPHPKPVPAPDPKAKPAAEPPASDKPAEVPENPLKVAESVRLYEEKVKNASALVTAGIPIALSTQGCKDTNEFFENLRKAVAAGLSKDAALKALTIDSARIFGVDRLLGTLEVGKVANVTVMTGDFLKAESKVKMLYIDGHKIDPSKGEAPATPRFRFGGEEGR
jgi:imidazolonepropionase-like amidohydrolase